MGERRALWQRPEWRSVLSFTLGAVLLTFDFPVVGEWSVVRAPDWARLGVLAVASALQLGRERAPLRALLAITPVVAVDGLMGLSMPVLVIAFDLVFQTVVTESARVLRGVTVVLWVYLGAVLVGSFAFSPTPRAALLTAMSLGPLPVLPYWWGRNVRSQRERAEAERARADNLERIAELDRAAAVRAARGAMARDLHDIVAGHLSAIAIQSEALLTAPGTDPDRARAVLRSVRENSVASLTEMRSMIDLLRDGGPEDALTAPPRLREVDRLLRSARAAGLEVTAACAPGDGVPAAVDLSAYRILQEALTNAVKHAPGARAEVSVRREDSALVLEVVNTGPVGRQGDGMGLMTMTDRARAVGGELTAGPCGSGWRVRAELPVP
ncbi:sensor histidine kinase [Actinokineospora sp. G85]|uniref:sensor histidine kinase n=1 Tax=Actinokineospora sp. G85 TaxID=3406626 RepID=UPI003C70CD43